MTNATLESKLCDLTELYWMWLR